MASPAANQLTRQHRDAQAAIGLAVVRPVRQLAQQASTADVDGWFDSLLPRLLQIIRAGWLTSRGQADRYLRAHARAEGVELTPTAALWAPRRVVGSARVTGPVAFKEHLQRTGSVEAAKRAMVQRLPAAAQRQALAGGRDTIAQTVAESDVIVGWRRVTDADPCAFCAMLASRGATYESRGSVGRDANARFVGAGLFKFHDNDECTAEPLYEREDEPPEVAELYQQWVNATAGTSGKAAIREWRRYWDKREK